MTSLRPLAAVLAFGLMATATIPALAQTPPAPPADTPPVTEMDNDADDDGFDMGWLGLLGLAGLAGLRGRHRHDDVMATRTTNVR